MPIIKYIDKNGYYEYPELDVVVFSSKHNHPFTIKRMSSLLSRIPDKFRKIEFSYCPFSGSEQEIVDMLALVPSHIDEIEFLGVNYPRAPGFESNNKALRYMQILISSLTEHVKKVSFTSIYSTCVDIESFIALLRSIPKTVQEVILDDLNCYFDKEELLSRLPRCFANGDNRNTINFSLSMNEVLSDNGTTRYCRNFTVSSAEASQLLQPHKLLNSSIRQPAEDAAPTSVQNTYMHRFMKTPQTRPAKNEFEIEAKLQEAGLSFEDIEKEFPMETYPGLYCPITNEIFREPVILGTTGHTYERKAIEAALQKRPNIDPISNKETSDMTLTVNYSCKDIIISMVHSLARKSLTP